VFSKRRNSVDCFWREIQTPTSSGANPMIVSYNASVVKIYNAMSSPAHFENKKIFFNLKNAI
jgi:hypothetical protein